MTPRRPPGPSLKGRALRYLSQREHSRAELRRKLLPFARAEAVGAAAPSETASLARGAAAAGVSGIADLARGAGIGRRGHVIAAATGQQDRTIAAVEVFEAGAPDELDEVAAAEADARVERLLDELAAAGWLSDARAAESLVSTKASRFGASRLRRMLAERGVDREAADAALEQARATEFQRALEVWRRRFGEPATDAPGRARQQRFLLSRGFPAAIVRRITGGDLGLDDDTGDL